MKTNLFKSLFLALIAAMLPQLASAYDFMVNGLCYNYNSDGTSVTVTYYNYSGYEQPSYPNINGALNIPSSVNYNGNTYSVTSVGSRAFFGCSGLSTVTIPKSITKIEPNAFSGCTSLTSVTWNAKNCNDFNNDSSSPFPFGNASGINSFIFGNEVEHIPAYLCYNLSALTSVIIPNSVKSIGQQAFYGCMGLSSVTISNSVTTIGWCAFRNCTSLTRVNITDLAAWCNIIFDVHAYMGSDYLSANPLYYAHNLYLNGSKVANLVIPNGITNIKEYAFYNCTCLNSVTIPNSVASIGRDAFSGCIGLTSVTWNAKQCSDNNYDSFSKPPFNGLSGINSFIFGNEVEHIPAYICNGLTGLTSVTIPNSVTSVGNSAFSGCTGLTSVNWNAKNCNSSPFLGLTGIITFVFGDNVEQIPANLCYNLTGLTQVTIGSSVTSIGNYAFSGCSGLQKVVWKAKNCNDFNYYSSSPFYNTTGVKTISFGNEVEHIPVNLCNRFSELTSVTIPASVKSIGQYAFYNCTGLNTVYWNAANCNDFSSSPFQNLSGINTFIIENTVERLPANVCRGLTGLTKVNLPSPISLKEVGSGAFSGCTGLTSVYIKGLAAWCKINFNGYDANPLYYAQNLYNNGNKVTKLTIPSSVDSIGNYVFYGYNDLTSLTIGNSVKSIGSYAFSNCTGLTGELTIPSSVTDIRSSAFSSCSGLTGELNIPNSVTIINDGVFSNCTGFTSLVLGDVVTNIGSSAFSNCTGLTGELNIPNSVTEIGSSAFSDCTGLTGELTIPNSVTEIGYDAFYHCTGLTSLALGNSVTRIGGSAFEGCSGLTGPLTIPDSVTEIEYDAFQDCAGFTSLTLGNSVKEIGGEAFSGCTGMTGVLTIPNSVTDINSEAFYNCSGFTSAKMPNSVTYLGSYAFYGCSGLESLTIPDSLTRIRDKTFYKCSSLKNIYTGLNPEDVELGVEIFNYVPKRTCVLHVKEEYKSIFEMADQWEDFWNIVGDYTDNPISIPGDVNGDGHVSSVDVTAIYNWLLNEDDSSIVNGDVDGDGHISSVDVTAIYNILLGNQ